MFVPIGCWVCNLPVWKDSDIGSIGHGADEVWRGVTLACVGGGRVPCSGTAIVALFQIPAKICAAAGPNGMLASQYSDVLGRGLTLDFEDVEACRSTLPWLGQDRLTCGWGCPHTAPVSPGPPEKAANRRPRALKIRSARSRAAKMRIWGPRSICAVADVHRRFASSHRPSIDLVSSW